MRGTNYPLGLQILLIPRSLVLTFDVRDNLLSGGIPSELGEVVHIVGDFDLSTNELTSTIPTELGNLISVDSRFDLGNNGLTSKIPTELGKLQISSFLVLASNELTSTIPTELGELDLIRNNFMLNSNKLCGDVPSQVSALSSNVEYGWFVTLDNFIGLPCGKDGRRGNAEAHQPQAHQAHRKLRRASPLPAPKQAGATSVQVRWPQSETTSRTTSEPPASLLALSSNSSDETSMYPPGLVCVDFASTQSSSIVRDLSTSAQFCARPCSGVCNCASASDQQIYATLYSKCDAFDTWVGECSASAYQTSQRLAEAQIAMIWACLVLSLVVLCLGAGLVSGPETQGDDAKTMPVDEVYEGEGDSTGHLVPLIPSGAEEMFTEL